MTGAPSNEWLNFRDFIISLKILTFEEYLKLNVCIKLMFVFVSGVTIIS